MAHNQNVIVIGGGPAGLSAGIYLARAQLRPLIFAGSPPGGQLMLTSEVENFPGYDSILGAQLIENMRNQVKKFGGVIRDENITSVEVGDQLKSVVSTTKEKINTKTLIIATGAKALWLGVPGEEKLRGKGVSACATCDGFFFKNKIVAVVGGGDSALEEALSLTKFASKVYIIHRRDAFRASKVMQQRVFMNKRIEIMWNVRVLDIVGENKVEYVYLVDSNNNHKTNKLYVDGVFIAIGHKPDTDIFKEKVVLDEKGYVLINLRNEKKYQTMTSVEGVFAAGDCVDSVYRQASTAAGMGVAAALDVERWLESNCT